ncbi:MAG: hypothetical protein IIY16_02920, partial [Oscillospiraceae bacterium]|nr:hypothetical protein [Oscillospiraceae bacterium]
MKKLAALLLLLVLLAVLGACGGAETTEEFNLPTTDWVEIYRGSILTLNPDRTMTLGDAKGTWKMEDNCVTLTYRTENGKIVRSAELMEENGFTLLRADTTGTITGQQRFFSESDYYPADQIDEAKKVVDLEAEND